MKNRILWIAVISLIIGLLCGGYFVYQGWSIRSFDSRFMVALKGVQEPHTYVMLDDTHATLSGRYIDISGVYRLDFDAQHYAADSTTTMTILDGKPHTQTHAFSLSHRAIGDDVYVRIDTQSELLKKTIPYDPNWKHFKVAEIPERFVNIAVPGAILDNLALLSNQGAYLSPTNKPFDATMGSTTYHVYEFTLSSEAKKVPTGQLRSLIDLIATGTVEVWIDDAPAVRILHMTGPHFDATSTVVSVNTPVEVIAPTVSE